MEIKAADVAKLRQMTGAGMMDCKKALVEAEGDFARAQEIIREKGKLVAAKRADRETSEGAVIAKVNGGKASNHDTTRNRSPAICQANKACMEANSGVNSRRMIRNLIKYIRTKPPASKGTIRA